MCHAPTAAAINACKSLFRRGLAAGLLTQLSTAVHAPFTMLLQWVPAATLDKSHLPRIRPGVYAHRASQSLHSVYHPFRSSLIPVAHTRSVRCSVQNSIACTC